MNTETVESESARIVEAARAACSKAGLSFEELFGRPRIELHLYPERADVIRHVLRTTKCRQRAAASALGIQQAAASDAKLYRSTRG